MAKSKAKARAAPRKPARPAQRSSKPKSTKSSSRNKSAAPPALATEPNTKTGACLLLLARPGGASLAELQKLTGWQPHSVRGFLSGTVKKIEGLTLVTEKPDDGPRRYRVQRAKP